MKTIVGLMLVFMMMFVAAPAFSGGVATQMWKCELNDEVSEETVNAYAKEWLTAAKKIKGGERLEAYVYFPVAVNTTGGMDFMFVVAAPTFEEWGRFWDNYGGSQAAELERRHNENGVVCPDSVVWEATKIK